MFGKFMCLAASTASALPAVAQPLSHPVFVLGEQDTPANIACGVTTRPLENIVAEVLTDNRVAVQRDRAQRTTRVYLAVNVTSVRVNGSCAVALSIRLFENDSFVSSSTGQQHFGKFTYCDREGVFGATGGFSLSQDAGRMARAFANECLLEYQQSIMR